MYFPRNLEKLYEDLKPLMKLDPLVLPKFMFVCPKRQLSSLYFKIPPYYTISFMALQLQRKNVIKPIEVIIQCSM